MISANEVLDNAIADLSNPSKTTRLAAVRTLGQLGINAEKAVLPLTALLSDSDPEIRYRTAQTLQKIGRYAKRAVPALQQALNDSDPHIRYQVAKAIMATGNIDARPAAEAVLAEGKPRQLPSYLLPSQQNTSDDQVQ
ncbi:MAG: HEAT repeat domain-containing protein [Rickettsiales bacterium]|nr:HEAT repeat domain-containing protein [Rickettsiales bacterium]